MVAAHIALASAKISAVEAMSRRSAIQVLGGHLALREEERISLDEFLFAQENQIIPSQRQVLVLTSFTGLLTSNRKSTRGEMETLTAKTAYL